MAHGGPSRSSGMSLMAEHGTVSVALPTGPLRCRSTEPLWSSSPRSTASRADAAARPARGRDLRRDHRRRRAAGHQAPRLARAGRGAARLARRASARPTRRSPPRAGSRSAAAPRRSSAPCRPRLARASERPGRRAVETPRRRVDAAAASARRGSTSRRRRRISSLFPRRAWSAALRRAVADMPDAALDYARPARRRRAARGADRVPRAGARAGGDRRGAHERLHAGAVADVPGAGRARGDAGRGRGPVARRRVGDDPLRRAWRSSGCRSTSTACVLDGARRRRDPGHARAPVPDRGGARAGAAAGAAGLGRDRDRGRLRLRVPLRPRAGRDAAAARARPRRLSRHGVEDARARAAARLAGGAAGARGRDRARALGGRLGRRRGHRARLRAAAGRPARSTATCAARAASTASAATGWSRRSTRRGFEVGGVAAGLHLLLRLPPGTDEAAVVERLAEQRIRIRGLACYSLSPQPPALVLGYGRLPLAAIDAAVDQLTTAV